MSVGSSGRHSAKAPLPDSTGPHQPPPHLRITRSFKHSYYHPPDEPARTTGARIAPGAGVALVVRASAAVRTTAAGNSGSRARGGGRSSSRLGRSGGGRVSNDGA